MPVGVAGLDGEIRDALHNCALVRLVPVQNTLQKLTSIVFLCVERRAKWGNPGEQHINRALGIGWMRQVV